MEASTIMDSRSVMVTMLLAAGLIGPLTGLVVGRLAGGITGTRVGALTEVCMDMRVVLVIILDGVRP